MKTVTLFDLSTGDFRSVLSMPEKAIAANVPDGCGYKEGRFDRLSQRVDTETGAVVEHQPPQPDDDHEWRENVVNGRPRWVKKPEVVQRERIKAAAQRDIERLEISQLRPMRELAIDPASVEAKQRLEQIEAAIAIEREKLKPDARLPRDSEELGEVSV